MNTPRTARATITSTATSRRTRTSVRGLLALALTMTVVTPLAAANAVVASASAPGPSTEGVIVWTDRTPNGSHLMIARADGSQSRSLTPVVPGDDGDIDAQVSPDGRWIAYEHDAPDFATIRLVRPDGTADHKVDIPCVDTCAGVQTPTWLSNGRLAFTVIHGPFDTGFATSAALWTSRLDGSHAQRLSQAGIDGSYEDYSARPSPDGSYLTFRRGKNNVGQALFRMNTDGSHLRQLTPYAIQAEVNDLSTARGGPTKDLLVFESYGRGDPDKTFADIATVPTTCTTLADCTSKIVWLTDNGASGRRNANPQWSPDGSSVVFTDRAGVAIPDAEIWTMRYLGTQRRKISNSPDFDFRPTWGVTCE